MEDKTSSGLREQRLRRRRINRMKSTIVMTLALWVLLSMILIVVLLIKLFSLEHKVDKIAESMISVEQIAEGKDTKGASLPDEEPQVDASVPQEDGSEIIGNDNTDAVNVQNQMDMENQKVEGQTQKVYLTFDDGPSENTAKILDILKEKNVKATFFVIGKEDEESRALYQRIVAEGHTLGMHSFSHKYSVIYDSLEAFEEDVNHLRSYLAEITGEEPDIIRFPGGSSNQVSNTDMTEFIHYLNQEGITYYDWNVASGDATSQAYTADELVQNVITDVEKYDTSIVLMHDAATKGTTVDALGPMIDQLQTMGVELLPIDENTKPIQHIPADSVN
ncbi:polysaccharide deacetylase family protein [Roseburia sp. 499]|uniref:polysaccharide deacetylase family protein n=1 Tax=Roseburia sp. 499 TaxID=1261634 RepID=UPI0009522C0F|nr:polysaccharide deacetylase family protein [Roseburia sp. 499]WVK71248.1 polysaccharide deacetylase family protein [Roseburia sp. 499]